MGSNSGDATEKPVHTVQVAAFELDQYEVTVAQYAACVAGGGCTAALLPTGGSDCNAGVAGKDQHPINCVDWDQASAYCAWAGKRLPTEEEWEYAARGTDGREYPWGDAAPATQLCWDNSSGTCAVGSYPSGISSFGIHDMGGNVSEWTASYHSENYSLPRGNTFRVYRGGNWNDTLAIGVRGAYRNWDEPEFQHTLIGIRCAH
jgi:formylglycine-generating enzyme required for sulfatase activity